MIGSGVVAGYLFALHDLDLSVADSRTVALTTLVVCGLYLVLALEAGGSLKRSALVGGMCAVMGGLYVLALLLPSDADVLRVDRAFARDGRDRDPRRLGVDRGPRLVWLLATRRSGDDGRVSRADQNRSPRVRDHRGGDAAKQRGLGSTEPTGADHDRLGAELVGNLTDRLPCLSTRHPGGGIEAGSPRERDALLRLVAG